MSRTDGHPRRTLSVVLAVGQLALSAVWLVQGPTAVPGRISWIAQLDDLWPWLFGVAGAVLLVLALLRHRQQLGHAACAGSCAAYSLAAVGGALSNTPAGNLAVAVAFALLAATHHLVSVWYRRRPCA